MVKAAHLSKRYGAKTALYDVSFSIGKGEVVGFLGPNGAGKSTTMNLLCGYLEPTCGQVEIAGVDMALQPLEARRHIGYLPEIPPLYMDMTVAEQLLFACDLRGLPERGAVRRAYIDSLCRRTELLDVRDRLIRSLSKGYRQRVAVTQLLVGSPEILILDEPTVGLDPRQIREFRDLLAQLAQEHTIILSSHILSEIRSSCSRILVFSEGILIADGQPERLQEDLSGRRVLLAEVRGGVEAVTQALAAVPGVVCVEAEGDGETRQYRISHRPGTDIRGTVYEALKPLPCTLLTLRPQEVSLESLYLEITRRNEEA